MKIQYFAIVYMDKSNPSKIGKLLFESVGSQKRALLQLENHPVKENIYRETWRFRIQGISSRRNSEHRISLDTQFLVFAAE